MVKKKEYFVRQIGEFFYVVNEETKARYKLDQHLNCECKGFAFRNKCIHQQEVINYIFSGEPVNLVKRQSRSEHFDEITKVKKARDFPEKKENEMV